MLVRTLRLVLLGALSACSLATAGLGSEGAGAGGASGASSATSGAGASGVTSGSGGPTGDWWDDAFKRRVRITFKNDGGEALTDFPVMVKLDATRIDYGTASKTGADLRFVDADGKTLLAHEIDRWSPADSSFVWVRVPTIDAGSGTDHMWLYYGNPAATDTQAAKDVWTGFVGVYHLSPNAADPTAVVDSTGAFPGKWFDQIGNTLAGVIGDAVDLDGSQFVTTDDINDFSVEPGQARTVEVWLNPKVSQEQSVVDQEGQCKGWILGTGADGSYAGHLITDPDPNDCGPYNEYLVTKPGVIGAWHYVTLVMDRPAFEMRLLVDGVRADARMLDNSGDADGNGVFQIGADWEGSHGFNGFIDEVRVSSSARSDGWIAAQHRSMTDGFLRFDAE
jgi:hypothetical protein